MSIGLAMLANSMCICLPNRPLLCGPRALICQCMLEVLLCWCAFVAFLLYYSEAELQATGDCEIFSVRLDIRKKKDGRRGQPYPAFRESTGGRWDSGEGGKG